MTKHLALVLCFVKWRLFFIPNNLNKTKDEDQAGVAFEFDFYYTVLVLFLPLLWWACQLLPDYEFGPVKTLGRLVTI